MENNDILKLRASLGDAIKEWLEGNSSGDELDFLNTYFSDHSAELMASSAFNILLSQSDLTEYYKREKMFNE